MSPAEYVWLRDRVGPAPALIPSVKVFEMLALESGAAQ